VTIVALSISHVVTSLKLARTGAELKALRERLKLTPVEGADVIAARSLPTSDKDVRRWTVFLPNDKPKMLYVNFGEATLPAIRNATAKSTSKLRVAPDPVTHETWVELSVEANPNNPEWGSIWIKSAAGSSMIAIDPPTLSLLLGKLPGEGHSVGDRVITRSSDEPMILFEFESQGSPKAAFCLWLDDPPPGGNK
jgi:hypothetical protein